MLPLEAVAKAGGLNWSELYAIVGSLFESNMSVPQHLAMLEHLPREQRCAVASADRAFCQGFCWRGAWPDPDLSAQLRKSALVMCND